MARQLDLSKTPWNVQKNFEDSLKKEARLREKWNTKMMDEFQQKTPIGSAIGSQVGSTFSVPDLGEHITLRGLRGRSQLNGTIGQVASSDVDEDGFMLVRVPASATGTMEKGSRQIRVHHKRIELSNSASSPVLRKAGSTLSANNVSHLSGWSVGVGSNEPTRADRSAAQVIAQYKFKQNC